MSLLNIFRVIYNQFHHIKAILFDVPQHINDVVFIFKVQQWYHLEQLCRKHITEKFYNFTSTNSNFFWLKILRHSFFPGYVDKYVGEMKRLFAKWSDNSPASLLLMVGYVSQSSNVRFLSTYTCNLFCTVVFFP